MLFRNVMKIICDRSNESVPKIPSAAERLFCFPNYLNMTYDKMLFKSIKNRYMETQRIINKFLFKFVGVYFQ